MVKGIPLVGVPFIMSGRVAGNSENAGFEKAVGERAERQHSVLSGKAGREANESIETSNATAPREQCED